MHRTPWTRTQTPELDALLTREWLVTNGLGGYAAGTLAGVPTRRYHGLLIAALPSPFGRTLLLPSLLEQLLLPDGTLARLRHIEQTSYLLQEVGAHYLTAFHLEMGLPVWHYEVAGTVLEKRVLMPHGQNTVLITYRLIAGDNPLHLQLLPHLHCRPHEASVSTSFPRTEWRLMATADRYELLLRADHPSLRMLLHGQHTAFTREDTVLANVYYRVEARRGYESTGELWSPGYFQVVSRLALRRPGWPLRNRGKPCRPSRPSRLGRPNMNDVGACCRMLLMQSRQIWPRHWYWRRINSSSLPPVASRTQHACTQWGMTCAP